MPRLTKIYTKTGDGGLTSLGGGVRVPKDCRRVETYGTVDELNSALGVALAHGLVPELQEAVAEIQNELLHLGADLCILEREKEERGRKSRPAIQAGHVEKLEAAIDKLNDSVGPLANFILPGGTVGAAHLQLARTICRRAERHCTALARDEPTNPEVLIYLNRLSDALFVMARFENLKRGVEEPLWDMSA